MVVFTASWIYDWSLTRVIWCLIASCVGCQHTWMLCPWTWLFGFCGARSYPFLGPSSGLSSLTTALAIIMSQEVWPDTVCSFFAGFSHETINIKSWCCVVTANDLICRLPGSTAEMACVLSIATKHCWSFFAIHQISVSYPSFGFVWFWLAVCPHTLFLSVSSSDWKLDVGIAPPTLPSPKRGNNGK
jgi:hypothetical protein